MNTTSNDVRAVESKQSQTNFGDVLKFGESDRMR